MSKSAIYAIVKTLDRLLIPFGAGMAVVQVDRAFGFWWGCAAFIPGAAVAVACTYLGDLVLKKMNVPNY